MAILSTASAISSVVFPVYENLWTCLCESFFGSMCFIIESPINTMAFVLQLILTMHIIKQTKGVLLHNNSQDEVSFKSFELSSVISSEV